MKPWRQEDLDAFLRVIDPADDATGGGTASAVAGAMGAGLVGMVARVSIGREGMREDAWYEEIDAEARRLTSELMTGGCADSEAFGAVMDAYRLPRDSEERKAERSRRIREAMVGATRVPLENGLRCLAVLEMGRRLEAAHNQNASSDLAVGLSLARAGLEGCIANVDINLGSVKDGTEREKIEVRARELREGLRRLEGESDG
ncbi:MAG: cyclodeaminase/cyclohydrolase family protein [Gemmatimonadota bacterium]|nr:cyclodeaminase/cyclohydrolase family protein [Gemmatimonadota bacterium]